MIDTQEQALTEARKRWGKHGWARRATGRHGEHGTFVVGLDRDGWAREQKGRGYSYDAAFADADKREDV